MFPHPALDVTRFVYRWRMHHRTLSLLVASLAFVSLLALAPTAQAQRDRPLYAGFGGGAFLDFDCCAIHGRITGEFGWHFGREDTGFVMAIEAATNLGPDYFSFLGGLRLGGDIEVHGNQRFGIMLRPSGLVGVALRDYANDGREGIYGSFVVQPAFDIRFAVADRAVVFWLRPVAIDIQFYWADRAGRDWYARGAYQALAGIDFQF